jgi:hypothetical protein
MQELLRVHDHCILRSSGEARLPSTRTIRACSRDVFANLQVVLERYFESVVASGSMTLGMNDSNIMVAPRLHTLS